MAKKGTIDLSRATILTPKGSTIMVESSRTCPAPPAVCINLREADIDGEDIVIRAKSGVAKGVIDLCGATFNDSGADFPTINGDSTPPYSDPSVLDERGGVPGAARRRRPSARVERPRSVLSHPGRPGRPGCTSTP